MTDTESGNGTELFGKLKMGKEFSIPMNFLFCLSAAIPVVPEPMLVRI